MSKFQVNEINHKPIVALLKKDTDDLFDPCQWTYHCPNILGDMIDCADCPALESYGKLMTYEEALKWWKKQ